MGAYSDPLEGNAVLLVGYYNSGRDFPISLNQYFLLKNSIQVHEKWPKM